MKFFYRVEKTNENGVAESAVQEFEKADIKIGRGASCDILLNSPLVSLAHAVLKLQDGKLVIEDLGSAGGVRVNNTVVKHGVLKAGDVLKLGNISMTVANEGEVWGLVEERRDGGEGEPQDEQALLQSQLKGLDLASHFPSFTLLSAFICLVIIVVYFFLPVFGGNLNSWSAGPISPQHKMIETNCQACHSVMFKAVQDKDCLACHQLTEHAESLAKVVKDHPEVNHSCGHCHMEHNGPHGLIARQSQQCTECHANLSNLKPDTKHPNIKSFDGDHPQFRVSLPGGAPDAAPLRVSLDAADKLTDGSKIKYNHKVHLVKGEDEPSLECRDCHEFSEDKKTIKPISFDKHCRSCHNLEFDERLPGNEVPHGDADEVINYVFAEYAKIFLQLEKRDTETGRLKPGAAPGAGDEAKTQFAREAVQEESRKTEEQLFMKTGCQLCHVTTELKDFKEGKSRYSIEPTGIPTRWMPASVFDHGAHQQISCVSCHTGVQQSTKTTDVLMPKIGLCRDCHAQEPQKGKVTSDCVECHSYHDSEEFDDEKRRGIKEILDTVLAF